jgi:hypothetical protein
LSGAAEPPSRKLPNRGAGAAYVRAITDDRRAMWKAMLSSRDLLKAKKKQKRRAAEVTLDFSDQNKWLPVVPIVAIPLVHIWPASVGERIATR